MSRSRCETCTKKGPCEIDENLECRSYVWNEVVYKGEKYGMKCMRCSGCNTVYENALWYSAGNAHFCPVCNEWKPMGNLDNEEFNPSRR